MNEFVADDTHVYFSTVPQTGNHYLMRASATDGSGLERVTTVGEEVFGLAVDDYWLYWTEESAGEIKRIRKPS